MNVLYKLDICPSKTNLSFSGTKIEPKLKETSFKFHFPNTLYPHRPSVRVVSLLQPPAPLTLAGWRSRNGQQCSRLKQRICHKETHGVWSLMNISCLIVQTRAGRNTSGTQVQGQCAGVWSQVWARRFINSREKKEKKKKKL